MHLHRSVLRLHLHGSVLRLHLHRSVLRLHLHGSVPRLHLHGSVLASATTGSTGSPQSFSRFLESEKIFFPSHYHSIQWMRGIVCEPQRHGRRKVRSGAPRRFADGGRGCMRGRLSSTGWSERRSRRTPKAARGASSTVTRLRRTCLPSFRRGTTGFGSSAAPAAPVRAHEVRVPFSTHTRFRLRPKGITAVSIFVWRRGVAHRDKNPTGLRPKVPAGVARGSRCGCAQASLAQHATSRAAAGGVQDSSRIGRSGGHGDGPSLALDGRQGRGVIEVSSQNGREKNRMRTDQATHKDANVPPITVPPSDDRVRLCTNTMRHHDLVRLVPISESSLPNHRGD